MGAACKSIDASTASASCPFLVSRSTGLLADAASQSLYCQQQGSGSGASRLAFCLDSHTGAGCSSSEAPVGRQRASGRRQYIGGWVGG